MSRLKIVASVKNSSALGPAAVDILPDFQKQAESVIAASLAEMLPQLIEIGVLDLSKVSMLDFLAYCNMHMMTNKKLADAVAEFEPLFMLSNSYIDKLVYTERKRLETDKASRALTPKTPQRQREGHRGGSPSPGRGQKKTAAKRASISPAKKR